jgi:hypothetical protein
VILDEQERSINSNSFSYLSSRRVKIVWSSSRFTYTHQKTLVVGGSKAVIMTANLTSEYYLPPGTSWSSTRAGRTWLPSRRCSTPTSPAAP